MKLLGDLIPDRSSFEPMTGLDVTFTVSRSRSRSRTEMADVVR